MMKFKTILFLLLFYFSHFIYAQEKVTSFKIDSLTEAISGSHFFNKEGLNRALELYHLAKEINYTQGQIKLLIRVVDIRLGTTDYKRAFENLKTLKALTLDSKRYNEYITAAGLEAKLYFLDQNYTQAEKILKDAELYLERIEDIEKRRRASIVIDIYRWANIDNSKQPKDTYLDSLAYISKKIYNTSLLLKNDEYRAKKILFATNMLTSTYTKLNNYEEATKYSKIGKKQIDLLKEEDFPFVDYYESKGDLELKKKYINNNYLDSALLSYNKALLIGERLNYTAKTQDLYAKLANIYKEKNDFKTSLKFLEKSHEIKEYISLRNNQNLNIVKRDLYNYESENKNYIYYYFLLFFVLVIIVTFLFYYKKTKSDKINKHNQLKEIMLFDDNSLSYVTNLAYNKDDSFFCSFLQLFPSFGDNLLNINKSIKPSDIEFCAFFKLNIETKQIAIIKNISVRAVEGRKYRIRKKLNIPSDENIYLWMAKI